jgi:hypothetical protein
MQSYLDILQNPSDSMGRMNQHAALGPAFFTPGQSAFRTAAQGYDADAAQYGDGKGHHPLNRIDYNDYDGTCTMTQMEPCDSGWLDPQVYGGQVTGARRA